MKLESEKVVVQAPMSYAGSAKRIWRLTGMHENEAARVGLAVLALALTAVAWTVITGWYLFFGILVVPYRVIRRGQRKDKRQALQHREMMAAVQQQSTAR
jgi:hypothetical protein